MKAGRRQWGRIAAATILAGASLASGAPAEASDLSTTQVIVPASGRWVDTGIDVAAGGSLEITAWGTWKDGETVSGPNGSDKAWPDNFLNLDELGVCSVCARRLTLRWGSLEGYIGNAPPAPGSYTSPAIRPEAEKVFFVGAIYEDSPPDSGRLWLNKNADAYSNYTVDNRGHVVANIAAATPSGGNPEFPPSGGNPEIPPSGSNPEIPWPGDNPEIPAPGNNPGFPMPGSAQMPSWVCLGGIPGSCNSGPNHPG